MMTREYDPPVTIHRGDLARLLDELRIARGMSQVDLARLVDMSEGQVSRILSGKSLPEPARLDGFADALGVQASLLHRAYALSVGLRLESDAIDDPNLSAVIALWPEMDEATRVAQRAAIEAFISAHRPPTDSGGS